MQTKIMFLITLVLSAVRCTYGELVEANLEVEPAIVHYFFRDENPLISQWYVQDYIYIPLPEVSLQPGDTFRANITFKDGRQIQMVNAPEGAAYTLEWQTEPTPEGTARMVAHDAEVTLAVEGWGGAQTYRTGHPQLGIFTSGEHEFTMSFGFSEEEMFAHGTVFGDFSMEFKAPTEVGGSPFYPLTYTENLIAISAGKDSMDDVALLEMVPEPGSLVLLGFGALMLRRERRAMMRRRERNGV
jgi:hypothetical protein